MAGYFTDYYADKILDHLNGVAAFSARGTVYYALTTTVLARTDVVMPAGAELVGFGYARSAMTNNGTLWSPAAIDPATGFMTSHNLVVIPFPPATSDYPGPIPGWAELDAPTGGNVLKAGSFTNQAGFATNGQRPIIAIGDLTVTGSGV